VTNVEYKLSDATANIYLELAMILAAGMEGIKYGQMLRPMTSEHSINPLPASLQDSLNLLKSNDTLLNILGPELSTAYIAVRELMLQLETSIEEEVMDAFNKA
jgi:glutamine synthetase